MWKRNLHSGGSSGKDCCHLSNHYDSILSYNYLDNHSDDHDNVAYDYDLFDDSGDDITDQDHEG